MEPQTTYPYVTFSFGAYALKQSEYTESLLTSLNSNREPYISSIRDIDQCLSHLESSPINNIEEIRIPSLNVLRILLTLSVSKDYFPNDIKIHGLNVANDLHTNITDKLDYLSSIDKPIFHSRAIYLLKSYISHLQSNFDSLLSNNLYNSLKIVFEDVTKFVKLDPNREKEYAQERRNDLLFRASLNENRERNEKNFNDLKLSKSFGDTPKKGFTLPLKKLNKRTRDDLEDSRLSPIDTSIDITAGSKYEPSSQSTDIDDTYDSTNVFEHRDEEILKLKLFQPKLNSLIDDEENHIPDLTKSVSARSGTSSPVKNWNWHDIKVLDLDLITKNLNPKFLNYNIWKLLNWTFYCAEISSDNSQLNSHFLYKIYRDFLNVIFDFLIINFLKDENQPYLIEKLISQLSALKKGWFDRVVEFTLNGLKRREYSSEPRLCYLKDNNLVNADINKSSEQKDIAEMHSQYSDIFDSLNLRFKILILIYNWSLTQEVREVLPSNLTNHVTTKFNELDWRIFKEFYECGQEEISNLPLDINYQFFLEFSEKSCLDIIKSVEIDISFPKRIDEIEYNSTIQCLQTFCSAEVYEELLEADIEGEKLYQKWMRLNIIFQWVLITLLSKNKKGYTTHELTEFYQCCKKADYNRALFFRKHLIDRKQEWLGFTMIFDCLHDGGNLSKKQS